MMIELESFSFASVLFIMFKIELSDEFGGEGPDLFEGDIVG